MEITLTRQQADTIMELLKKVQNSDNLSEKAGGCFAFTSTPVPISGDIVKDGVSIQWAFKGDNAKVKAAIKSVEKDTKGTALKFVSWKLRWPIEDMRRRQYAEDKCITLEIK